MFNGNPFCKLNQNRLIGLEVNDNNYVLSFKTIINKINFLLHHKNRE